MTRTPEPDMTLFFSGKLSLPQLAILACVGDWNHATFTAKELPQLLLKRTDGRIRRSEEKILEDLNEMRWDKLLSCRTVELPGRMPYLEYTVTDLGKKVTGQFWNVCQLLHSHMLGIPDDPFEPEEGDT